MAIYRQCKANTSNIAAVIRTAAELFACLIVLDRTLLKLDIKNVDDETAVEPLVIDATVLQYCVISYMHIGYIALSHFEKINSITKTSQSTTLNCSKIISRCHINMNNKQELRDLRRRNINSQIYSCNYQTIVDISLSTHLLDRY